MTTQTAFHEFEFDESLLKAILEKHSHFTAIQEQAIPAALSGKDILGSSPTGTGKTWAFLIPAIQHLLDFPRRKPGAPRILILVPTRELVMQIAAQTEHLTKYTPLKTATITGGVAYMNHAEIFKKNQDIVIATTGRLLQYIKEENFDCRAIEMLILDEADRMLDMGFSQDVETISAETRWRKQTLLFSATLEGHDVYDFAKRILHDPVEIIADPSRRERKKIHQYYYRADNLDHKKALLTELLTSPECSKSIVFVRKRERVHELVGHLQQRGLSSCFLEGEMPQTKRNDAITRFQTSNINILIATDVAARGLDISDITHVINFDMPRTGDVYLHRIGRTGRAGKKGIALSLVEAHDHTLLEKIENYIHNPIKLRVLPNLKPKTHAPGKVKKKKPSQKVKQKQEHDNKKVKLRHRDIKNIGKRRKPTSEKSTDALKK